MHTFELQRTIKLFFAEQDKFEPFTIALAALSQSAEAMEAYLPTLARGGSDQTNSASQIHSYLAQVRKTTERFSNRLFFKALEHFQTKVNLLQASNNITSELVSNINTEIEEFSKYYDTFISNQSGYNAAFLLISAKALYIKIKTLFESLQLIDESVGDYSIPNNSEAQFSLFLPASLDLKEFAQRLLAIQAIYSELCMLLSLPESSHPLRISKIESGSLWTKLFGEARVINMMASFLEHTASWVYKNYTNEGKISSIPKKVEAIDSLIKLTDRLNDIGVDTSNMKAHIEKSAVAISKNLAEILDGQSSVTINEKTISIGSELSKECLEQTKQRQLLASESMSTDELPVHPPQSNP